jgi:putative oxidoreductase
MATNKSRLYVPGLSGIYDGWAPLAEFVLRAGLGGILLIHGLQKLFGWVGGAGMTGFIGFLAKFGYPMPELLGWYIALLETLGGILLIIGLWVRPVALLLVLFMIAGVHYTASTGAHWFIWFRGGLEFALLIGLVSFYIMVNGAGPWSLDKKQAKEF